MNTNVTIQSDGTQLTEELVSIPMIAGNSVTLAVTGGDAFLVFGDEAAAALSPAPQSPVLLCPGADLTYTFGDASPGVYRVMAVNRVDKAPGVIDFDPGGDGPVLLVSVQGGRGDTDKGGSPGT